MQLGNNSLAQVALGAISPFATDDLLEFTAAEFELAPSVMPLGPFVPWLTRQWEFETPVAGLSAPMGWTVAALEIEPSASPLWVQVPWVATSLELDAAAPNMLTLLGGATTQFWLTPWLVQAGEADTTVVVFNANTLAATEYSVKALDVVDHEGGLYFVTAPGLVKLDATATIDTVSYVRTGKVSLASGQVTGARFAHLSFSAGGPVELRTYRDDDGVERVDRYPLPVVPNGQARERTTVLGKGAQASAWSFEFRAVDTTTRWSLSGMQIEVPFKKHRL